MVVAEITGLMAYTNYTVQVAAVNDQGEQGPLSQPASVFTPEAGILYSVCRGICVHMYIVLKAWHVMLYGNYHVKTQHI